MTCSPAPAQGSHARSENTIKQSKYSSKNFQIFGIKKNSISVFLRT